MNGHKISELELRYACSGRQTELIVAFHIVTGRVAWMLLMSGSSGSLFSTDGIIYGTCRRDNETAVFAIEGETGRELWRCGLKPQGYGRVLAHDGRIYYADDDGNMYSVLRP
jgi:outer membrane protein assembly factor BamB